ncbi:MAG: immunoglobulin domain-containing protein [Chitinophagales bacterium]
MDLDTYKKGRKRTFFFALCCVFLFSSNRLTAQLGWEWAKQISNGGYAYTTDVTHDRYGDVYVLGRYSGTLTIGAQSISTVSPSSFLPFVAKFNPSGNLIWLHTPTDNGTCVLEASSIVVDSNTNVYYGGYSPVAYGSAYFANGNDTTYFLAGVTPVNEKYGYITKLNSSGVAKWTNRFKCEKGNVDMMKLAINRYRNKLFFAFSTTTTNTSYNSSHYSPGSSPAVVTGLGNCDNTGFREAFYGIVNIDNGYYVASQRIGMSAVGTTGQEFIKALAADNSGNLLIACDFINASAFTFSGGGPLAVSSGNSNRYGRIFRVNGSLGNVASTGNLQLSATIPTTLTDMAINKSTDEIAYTYEGGSFATQPTHIYVRAMNTSFVDVWQNDIASSGYNSQIAASSICYDSTGRVWLAITTNGAGAESMNFTPAFAAGSAALNPINNANYGTLFFRMKYTGGGNATWEKYVKVKNTGTHTLRMSGFDDRPNVEGRFSNVITLSKNTFTNSVGTDGYLAKIGCAPIVAVPPSDSSICLGVSHTLSAVVDGDAVSYAWYKNNVLLANSGNLSGVNTNSISFVNVTASDTGFYKVIATNSCGSDTSSAAHLRFSTTVQITNQPVDQTACVGGSVSFTIGTSPFCTYQWKKNNVALAGQTNDTLLINNVSYADSGSYTCVVTNCNGAAATSNVAKINFGTASVVLASGLVVHYPMGNGAAVNDVSGNALHLLAAGAAYTTDHNGTANAALQVPNQTSVNSAVPIASFTNQFTMSCWMKSSSISSNQRLIDKNNSNNFLMDIYLSRPRVIMLGNAYHPTNSLSSNTWYHLACTYDGANVKQYINGVLILTTAASGNITNNSNPLIIGADQGGGNVLQGAIDDVRIYNRALDATEISAMMEAPAITQQPANVTACSGNSATFTVAAVGTGLSYQWKKNGVDIIGANSASLTLNNLALSDSGNYSCIVLNGCYGSESKTAKLTLSANNISFTTQPLAVQNKCVGTAVSFTAATTGASPTSYVWKKNGVTISNGGAVSGATTATLTIAAVAVSDSGNYTLTVGGGSCGAIVSNIGRLNVNANPVAAISPASAAVCAGASTTLTASGATSFNWSNSLGTNASVSVSPTIATTYTVTVTDGNNCSATASRLVTVNALPTAAITPATVTICSGASATLTASGGGTYSWSNSGGNAAAATFSPTGITTYTVTVSNANCSATASRLVTVNALPIVTISPASASICAGSSAVLTASGASTYNWSNSGGNNAAATFSPANTATYTVTGTDANNCTATASRIVTVNALPPATITPSSVAICAGTSTTLTASGGTSYSWSNSLGSNAAVTVSPSGNTTYTVTVSDANCSATASRLVSVNALPVITILPSTATSTCQGSAVTLLAGGALTFNWSNGLGSGNTKNVSPSISTTYSVTGTDGNNCSASASKLVTVNDTIIIMQQPLAATICEGGNLNLSVTASGTGLSYQWKRNNIDITSATANNYSVSGASTGVSGNYTVLITGTCGSKTSAIATVLVNPATAITTNPVSQTTCTGSLVNFNVVASGANLTYQWKKGNSSISGAVNATYSIPNVAISDTGSYSVVVTGSCGTAQTSAAATLSIVSAASISQQPVAQQVCAGSPISLSVIGTGGNNTTYQWKKNNNNISGANASVFNIPNAAIADSGNYTVLISGSCGAITSNAVRVTVNPIPTVTISPNSVSICAGQQAALTATGGGTYAWSNGGGSAAQAVYSPSTNATYSVTATLNNCSASASQSVSVTAIPLAAISSQSSVCSGNSVLLTATGGGSYIWSNGGGNGATATFAPTTATTYSVTVSVGPGCTATASKNISVKQPSSYVFTQTICSGQNYLFNGAPRTQSGAYFDTLTNTAGCDSFVTLNLVVRQPILTNIARTVCFGSGFTFHGATLTQSGIYRDTLIAASGCDSFVVLNFTVRSKIQTVLQQTICSGDTFDFNGKKLTAAGTYSDTLLSGASCDSFVNLQLSIALPSSITINETACGTYDFYGQILNTSGNYQKVISNLAGCDSVINLNLIVHQPSAAHIYDTICYDAGYVFGSQNLTTGGSYQRTIANVEGCDSVITLDLFVRPLNQPIIVANGPDLSTAATFSNYEWSLNGNAISGAVNSQYTATQNGVYSVRVHDQFGCAATSADYQFTGVGISNVSDDLKFNVNPNPAVDKLVVEGHFKELAKLEITDLTGRIIVEQTIENRTVIDIHALAPATYLVRIGLGNAAVTKKFVKQ